MKKPYDIEGMPDYLYKAVKDAVMKEYNKTTDKRGKEYLWEIMQIIDGVRGNMELTPNQYFAILQAMKGPGADVFNKFVNMKKNLSVFKGLGS